MPTNLRKIADSALSRSERRECQRSRRRRVALLKSGVGLVLGAVVLLGLRWVFLYPRRPPTLGYLTHASAITAVALIAVLLAFFMIVEAILLTGAAITMRKPELYQRFVDLMMYWPTALVMPYMVVRNRGLQQKLVLRGAADQGTPPTVRIRRRATRHKNERAPNVSAESTSGSEPIRIAAELNEATLSAQSDLNHTLAEYRRALRLVIERSEALQQDQDMLDLILRLLSASETADQADGQARQPGAGISSVPPDEERGPLDKAKSLELHTKNSDNGLGRYAART